MWRYILSLLAGLSADPAQVDAEPPRSYASVAAAYAGFAPDAPAPAPEPAKCGCGGKCVGGIYKPDGRIEMRCTGDCGCGCQKKAAAVAEKSDGSPKSGQR